jgi:predicted HAD superfamily phosphohydrolase YqeG
LSASEEQLETTMLDNMIIKVKNKKQKKMLLDWKDKIRNSERNNSVFKNGKCKHYRSKEMSLLVHKPM